MTEQYQSPVPSSEPSLSPEEQLKLAGAIRTEFNKELEKAERLIASLTASFTKIRVHCANTECGGVEGGSCTKKYCAICKAVLEVEVEAKPCPFRKME